MWDEPNVELKGQSAHSTRNHEGRLFIWTAGRWPRKSAPAKKCVTTYLPNGQAPKMDGAQVSHDFLILGHLAKHHKKKTQTHFFMT